MKLFCAITDDDKLLHIKYRDEISVIPVWRKKANAVAYLAQHEWGNHYGVVALSFDTFDEARTWCQQSGIQLFLHLLD